MAKVGGCENAEKDTKADSPTGSKRPLESLPLTDAPGEVDSGPARNKPRVDQPTPSCRIAGDGEDSAVPVHKPRLDQPAPSLPSDGSTILLAEPEFPSTPQESARVEAWLVMKT